MLQERTKNAQFIIISLRSQMFELADRLVGIYKTYNTTKSVTINPAKIISSIGEESTPASASSSLSTTMLTNSASTAESTAWTNALIVGLQYVEYFSKWT